LGGKRKSDIKIILYITNNIKNTFKYNKHVQPLGYVKGMERTQLLGRLLEL
jgi:hypothetical protein